MPKPKPRPFTEKDKEEWLFWNSYIQDNGGWLVSQPDIHHITLECPIKSILPDLLRSAGLDVASAGTTERLLPSVVAEHRGNSTIATQSVSPQPVAAFSFKLPMQEDGPVRAKD